MLSGEGPEKMDRGGLKDQKKPAPKLGKGSYIRAATSKREGGGSSTVHEGFPLFCIFKKTNLYRGGTSARRPGGDEDIL